MNHMIHIAAVTQVRLDTEGRASYRRKRAEGKKPMEAMRCLKRKALRRHLSPSPTSSAPVLRSVERVREGAAGRLKNPARSTCLCTSTLRINHFPDPHTRRYPATKPHANPCAASAPR